MASVPQLPILPLRKPSSLTGVTNGALPSDLLVEVGPSGKLHRYAARAFLAMCAAARVAGFYLTYTYGGTYRSYAQQVTLFKQRYTTTVLEGRPSKVWNGQRWYLRPGVAAAATPGTSNHGWGLAIDLALDYDLSDGVGPNDAVSVYPALSWLLQNAASFGFSWELQSEPWHVRYVCGDEPPPAVEQWSGGPVMPVEDDPAPMIFDPANGHYALWPVNPNKPRTAEGAVGDIVKYLQGVLNNKVGQKLVVDGHFGPKTREAVVLLQTFARNDARFAPIDVDGVVGRQTWPVVDHLALH